MLTLHTKKTKCTNYSISFYTFELLKSSTFYGEDNNVPEGN